LNESVKGRWVEEGKREEVLMRWEELVELVVVEEKES
jgi:hypothetical protein